MFIALTVNSCILIPRSHADQLRSPRHGKFQFRMQGGQEYAPTALFLSVIEYETSVTAGSSGAAYDAGAGDAKIPRPSTAPTITAARRVPFYLADLFAVHYPVP